MRVLSLSLDPQVLSQTSAVTLRTARYGDALTSFTVIVPSAQRDVVYVNKNTTVYGSGGANKLAQFFRMVRIARKILSATSHDVVTSQDAYFLGFLAWALSSLYGCGLEIQAHGIEKNTILRRMLARFVLRHANSIRVVSARLAQVLTSEYGITAKSVTVVPVHVDVTTLGVHQNYTGSESSNCELPLQQFSELYKGYFNMFSAGRLVAVKNVSMQLQAIHALSKKFPDIRLHILGDGPLRASLEQEAEHRGIASQVIFHGHKTGAELGVFFKACDCFVHTADAEGYGMVIVEAAHTGLPIVTTNVGCAGEVITNEQSGIIIPPRDTAALIQALTRIISDTHFRERIAAGAQLASLSIPSFDDVLQKYIESLTRAAAKGA